MNAIILKLCVISCIVVSYFFSANSEEQFNQIDAFTSASIWKSFKVFNCSKVYSDRVELHWREYYNIDDVNSYDLTWGKDSGAYNNSISLFNQISVDPKYKHDKINISILENLEAGSKYYVQLSRNYNGDNIITNFVFTTPPLETIPPISSDNPGYIPPNEEGDTCYVDSSAVKFPKFIKNHIYQNTHIVEIVTVSGQYIASYPVSVFTAEMATSKLVRGLYLARFLDADNALITSKKLLIGK